MTVKPLTINELQSNSRAGRSARLEPPAFRGRIQGAVMNLLLDYRPALRDRTGVGEWVHQLALNLLNLKAEGDPAATNVALTLWSSSWRDRPAPSAVRELSGATFVDRRVPVRPLVWAWNRAGWPPIEALTSRRFDIVHSTTPLLLPSRSGLRVCTVYDLDFLAHPDRTRAEMRRDFPGLVRSHAGRADLVVTISEYSKAQVEQRLSVPPDRIAVCRPGVPSWIARPLPRRPPGFRGHLLFVGTLEPRKNVRVLLAAYRQLVEKHPDAPPLVLAGQVTPAAEAWVAEAQAPPLRGRVVFEGYVSTERREELYAGASLLALPSLDEGFGLPALEAMALGIPVVASTVGALPEVVGDAGILVDPADVQGLSGALEAVTVDPGLAGRMREAGIARSRGFNWPASARALIGAYEQALLHGASRRPARRRDRA
jgi:glycosyltransferase involved in cell wall biosynthesis